MIVVNKPLQKERRGKGEYRLVTTKNGKSRQITAAPSVVDKNIKGQDRGQHLRGKEKILESTGFQGFFDVPAHRFCCLHACIPQGGGRVRGEPLTGSPARVQSPARRRPLLRSKSAAPETKPPLRGGFVSGASSGIYPARGYKLRLPGGKTAKEKDTKRYLSLLVPRRGFEPRTPCLKGRCSTY